MYLDLPSLNTFRMTTANSELDAGDEDHLRPMPTSLMSKPPGGPRTGQSRPSFLADGLVFAGGAAVAVLIFYSLYSFLSPPSPLPVPTTNIPTFRSTSSSSSVLDSSSSTTINGGGGDVDPPTRTFYDDPTLSYTINRPLKGWDEKRRQWLQAHPAAAAGREKVLMLTGSQPGPCRNPVGDHLLLRFYKNKADYCRLHGIDLFYNNALLHPSMPTFWAKIPLLRAAMVAHPEAEWLYWVDSDAAITDMEFNLPISKYAGYDLVVHGWPSLVYDNRSWTSLNAGVFLLRNSQWSLDFMDAWSAMGPQTPSYERWGETLKAEFKDKVFNESDDQSGLVYLLLHDSGGRWRRKIHLESEFYFEGYWVEVVSRLDGIAGRYLGIERRSRELRRRRAEIVAAASVGREREGLLASEGARTGREGWRRPFITHFTGCQPCSGDHNKMYSGENCWEGMVKALDFADDQVLRNYGFRHGAGAGDGVRPLPFDFPAAPAAR